LDIGSACLLVYFCPPFGFSFDSDSPFDFDPDPDAGLRLKSSSPHDGEILSSSA